MVRWEDEGEDEAVGPEEAVVWTAESKATNAVGQGNGIKKTCCSCCMQVVVRMESRKITGRARTDSKATAAENPMSAHTASGGHRSAKGMDSCSRLGTMMEVTPTADRTDSSSRNSLSAGTINSGGFAQPTSCDGSAGYEYAERRDYGQEGGLENSRYGEGAYGGGGIWS